MKWSAVLSIALLVVSSTATGAQTPPPPDTTARITVRDSSENGSKTSVEACTKVRAYVEQVVGDSIKVLRKNGKLQQVIDSVQRTGQLNLDLSGQIPDSIRALYRTAGQSCKLIDVATIMKLMQSAPTDTAGKPQHP